MRLVEAIAREVLKGSPQLIGCSNPHPLLLAPLHKFFVEPILDLTLLAGSFFR